MSSQKRKIFISYSHRDESLKNELQDHLSSLRDIVAWNDRDITAGDNWEEQIDENLKQADLVLLLISKNFISSNYCYDKEMTYALDRHEHGKTTVVPIILRDCVWEHLPFGKLQVLPTDGKAITDNDFWSTEDKAFKIVVKGIQKTLKKLPEVTNNSFQINWNGFPAIETDSPVVESYKYNCDRSKQRTIFQEHFWDNDSSSFHFAFVSGDKEQEVDSFFKRVYLELLPDLLGDEIRLIDIFDKPDVTFKFGTRLDSSKKRFRRILEKDVHFEVNESLTKEFKAVEYIQLNAIRPYKHLVLHFKIFSLDWFKENHGLDFIKWMVDDFFEGCIQCVSNIKIIVYFSISFNHKGSLFSSVKSKKNKLKKEVEMTIHNTGMLPNMFCNLEELDSVEMEEIRMWFKKIYNNNDKINQVVTELFGKQERCLKMSEIELALHKLVDYLIDQENTITR